MMAVAVISSCDKCECDLQPYDDSQIKEAIKDLQDRVSALEDKVAENVAAIQSMVSLGSITSYEYDAQTGKGVITLLDGKKITIDHQVKGTSLMTVKKDTDGKYYWAVCKDGVSTFLEIDGKKVPVTVTPALKISENNEWMISVDGGATWVSTGIYQQVGSGTQNPPSSDTPQSPVFFKDVKVDGDMLVLVLTDGTELKVAIVGEALFKSTVDTLWYAAESIEKVAVLQMTNLKAFTITERPEGWKARISTDSLFVTSPSDISLSARSGAIKILGLFDGGRNPEIVTVEVVFEEGVVLTPGVGSEVNVKVTEHAIEDIGGYVIGAWKAEEYSAESVAQWLNTEEGYVSECHTQSRTFNVSELVSDYVETQAYVVFAAQHVPVRQIISGEMSYKAEDIQSVEIGSTQAKVGFSELYYDAAHLYLEISDISKYYGGFSEKGFWEALGRDYALENMREDNITSQTASVYDGPANGFPDGKINSQILPSTDYVVWIMPYSDTKSYKVEDFIIYSFTSPDVSANSSIAAPEHKVTEVTFGGFTADVTPASGAYKTYAAIRSSNGIPEDDYNLVCELIKANDYSEGSQTLTISSNSFSSDEDVYLLAVSLTKDGKYGTVLRQKVELKEMEYNTDLSVSVVKTSYGLGDVTLTLEFTGEPATISYYCSTYNYYTDEMTEDYLAKGQLGDAVNDISISSLQNGNQLYLTGLTLGAEYTIYVLVKDAAGNPSKMAKATFIPTNQVDYVMSTDANYTYGMPQISGTKSGTRYQFSVDMPQTCMKYWLFKGDPEYFTGDVYSDTDKLVTMQLELSGETEHTESIESMTYTGVMPYTRIYMAWLDDLGEFHAIYEFNPNN